MAIVMHDLLLWLIIGGLAGWIGGVIVSERGFGLFGDITLGITGAVIAGFVFGAAIPLFGHGLLDAVLPAATGTVIVLLVAKLIHHTA